MRKKLPAALAANRCRRVSRLVDRTLVSVEPTRRRGELIGGRYCIDGLLGRGATSDVYLAIDREAERIVVVKQLSSAGTKDDELRARFLREGHALGQLFHPGIIRVLDCGVPHNEPPFLVMELLVGETLSSYLERQPEVPFDKALLIARHVARGLAAAHEAGIVHRDVKPHNLFLLGSVGDPFAVKIIDFGMAKLPQSDGSSGVHTVLGTMQYMAPEQVMADPVDGRTDIYAFGIVLFRLFTGRLPFDSPKGFELLSHQLFSAVPTPSSVDPGIDPGINAVITRATRKHPDNRYSSMTELLGDLDQLLDVGPPFGVSFAPPPLVVDPDAYQPQNQKGAEVAELLLERYQSVVLPLGGPTASLPTPS